MSRAAAGRPAGVVQKASRPGRRRASSELRAAKDALYRAHILEAAERIFAEQGFDDTKMQDIARAVGISLATLYQAYPGKAELYRAILIARDAEMLETVMAHGQQVLQQPQSLEQLLWLMQTHLRFLLEHPDYLRMQLQQGHAWYHATAWPSPEEQQMWERGLLAVSQVLRWGQARGLFVPGDVTDQARLMMAMQQARLANWVSGGMQEPHAAVMARIQADFVRNFCRPQLAASLLATDGDRLNPETEARIRAAGGQPGRT
ncbi:MAG TPA: helix-turn-helix domain-containing protein [Nevskiales bacterium]|nr:helix-turn-helix domain-containing protein [Nevskiales bacterium]